jgi:hypothetical protein
MEARMDFPLRPVFCAILVVLALTVPRQPLAADNPRAEAIALNQQAIASYQQGRDAGLKRSSKELWQCVRRSSAPSMRTSPRA